MIKKKKKRKKSRVRLEKKYFESSGKEKTERERKTY